MLIEAAWPDLRREWIDREAEAEIELVIAAVTEGRSIRSELNVPPSARPELIIVQAGDEQRARLSANAAAIASTLRVKGVTAGEAPAGSVPFVVEGATLALPIAEFIDVTAERARLRKAVAGAESDAERVRRKLDNPQFMAKAPQAVVEENRAKLAEAEAARTKLTAALGRLETVG